MTAPNVYVDPYQGAVVSESVLALRERRKMFARMGLDIVDDIRGLTPHEDAVRDTLRYLRGFVDTLRGAASAEAGIADPENIDDELRGLASLLEAQVSLLESRCAGAGAS